MKSNPFRTIWLKDKETIEVIDQRYLPHRMDIVALSNVDDVVNAIEKMIVRGAPLIAATAAYGVYLALLEQKTLLLEQNFLEKSFLRLTNSRPTAVNLFWALERMKQKLSLANTLDEKIIIALNEANTIVDEDIETCRMIGVHGLPLIEEIWKKNGHKPVQILTHCNAGMLGCIEWGTITSPIYQAKAKGIDVHVWVDETRPRGQGSNLTAFELTKHNIPHTLIVDNTGGHLMQHGMVDMVLVGTDRTTRKGDVANKIGTYLKALAAFDNNVPFYVALPSTSIDWNISDGIKEIPIEERNEDEVRYVYGKKEDGNLGKILICPASTPAANYGFDVTPARLITGLITERGICQATETSLTHLFPEKA
jgi:methylthioribose-1-phosphate isomerase